MTELRHMAIYSYKLIQPLLTQTTESPFQAKMKTVATQAAPVVVWSPNPEVFFRKTELGAEDALCSQCGGWGSHWWHPETWALGPMGCAGHCMHVLRILLVSNQVNKEVPAVTSVETPVGMIRMKGPMTPSSAAAEQAGAEGLLALASPP